MNTWISDTKPLLSLILPFLNTVGQQKWRLAGSFARNMSDQHLAPARWKDVVLNQPHVDTCPICSRIHLISKMFYCSSYFQKFVIEIFWMFKFTGIGFGIWAWACDTRRNLLWWTQCSGSKRSRQVTWITRSGLSGTGRLPSERTIELYERRR